MTDKPRHAAQKKFIAKQQAAGLKRVILWARPEDIDDLKLAAQQPHSLAKLRAQIETDIRAELEPKIRVKVAAELRRKTERAMLVQKRKAARLQPADSNAPPERLRFKARPPGSIREALKCAGWLYDPVAVVWHRPTDPQYWNDTDALLEKLEPYGIIKLAAEVER